MIVADNGSDDGSAEIARSAGATVVHEPRRGYGSAYLAGFAAAAGDYIVMADADLTYDFDDIPRFVERLDGGADLVMGNRMENIQPGAMPWLHRYVGNPALTGVLNLFFQTGVRDAHCGMRAVRREALPLLDLRTTGMEFASEMVIRAGKQRLAIEEIPIDYHPREGESKLSSWRDGWRHLRFLLVHSPTYLFVLPGPRHERGRRADHAHRAAPARGAGARLGPARDGRRDRWLRSSAPRWWRWDCAPTPTARTSWASRTPGSTRRAPGSGWSTACCSGASSCSRGSALER